MKTTLITTVFNEEKNIGKFIDSILRQTFLPDEVVIVDGGSNDRTVKIIKSRESKIKNKKIIFKLIEKVGNRSVGRNEAIKKASGDIILLTDVGCILDKDWVKNIITPFKDKSTDVVAGYYKGISKNVFQKCVVPYVLVMPDRVNEKSFLPATRSMAFKKSIWKKMGGFNEKLSHNEDYEFAKRMDKSKAKVVFAKNAIVNWIPRKNLKEAFIMFFRFALGDIQANIVRNKVLLIFVRYAIGLYLLLLSLIEKSKYLNEILVGIIASYFVWSIRKNYKYVKSIKAIAYLPLLQFTSDLAVMLGTIIGVIQKISLKYIFKIVLDNKGLFFVLITYIFSMLSVIQWGIPNSSHPFTYHMDEWHQSQSVRNLFKFGTPNIMGSANGSIFQFFLTGLYLIPFYLLGLINVLAIKSSVTNLDIQHNLFIVLRFNTLIFGCFSILAISYIGKNFFKVHPFIIAFLFTVNPIWILLSNYFKYDIALIFWILMSLIFLLRYMESLSLLDFIAAGIFSGLALSTKLSAIPLLPIYIITFIIFTPKFYKKLKYLFAGVLVYVSIFFLFGIPDIILRKGSLVDYLSSNLIASPQWSSNYNFGSNYFFYMIFKLFPITFGHLFYYLFFVAFLFLIFKLLISIRNVKIKKIFLTENKNIVFLVMSFIFFFLSLIPLKLGATGNRVLVLLPFFALMVGLLLSRIHVKKKLTIKVCLILFVLLFISLQGMETYVWIKLKLDPDIRVTSSNWVRENIKQGTIIGLENIPIYQKIPNILLKEFYLGQYGKSNNFTYKYRIIDFKSKTFPNVLVLTDMEVEEKYVIKSDKNNLILRLKYEGYRKIKKFEPSLKYFYLFGNRLDFYITGLIPIPTSISIYEK